MSAKTFLAASTLLAMIFVGSSHAHAGETRVAVAANFTAAANEIGRLFVKSTGHKAVFSFGSTGQLYAQIAEGAPFDVFLAADRKRPERAIDEGYAIKGTRVTYAVGHLVLYSAKPDLVTGSETLTKGSFDKIAIANPKTAPYGAAAMAVLKALGIDETLRSKVIQGNSIGQTYQFIASGNADLGFVAASQIAGSRIGSRWLVPAHLYPVIAQDAVLLKPGADNPAAKAFLAFVMGSEARAVKTRLGYGSGD